MKIPFSLHLIAFTSLSNSFDYICVDLFWGSHYVRFCCIFLFFHQYYAVFMTVTLQQVLMLDSISLPTISSYSSTSTFFPLSPSPSYPFSLFYSPAPSSLLLSFILYFECLLEPFSQELRMGEEAEREYSTRYLSQMMLCLQNTN